MSDRLTIGRIVPDAAVVVWADRESTVLRLLKLVKALVPLLAALATGLSASAQTLRQFSFSNYTSAQS